MKSKKQRMNILISINSKYVPIAQVMLASLFKNNKYPMDIYMLQADLTKAEITEMENLVSKYGNKLIPLKVDKKLLKGAPVNRHISLETYYRLLAHELLPINLKRILYLDSDMVINGDISGLYKKDFEGKCFVVCEDKGISKKDKVHYKQLNLPLEEKYFNAGVLLYNLQEVRKLADLKEFFNYMKTYAKYLTWWDQDILNHFFYDKVLYENEKKYNSIVLYLKKKEVEYARKNSAIIHYASQEKPWNSDYKGELGGVFLKYALQTKYWKRFLCDGIKSYIVRLVTKV